MSIVVTGATGNIGRAVVDYLNSTGHKVRAMTRKPAKAGLPDGVTVVAGDFSAPETLPTAFNGAEKMFLFPDPRSASAVLRVAEESGIRHVVALSSGVAGDDEAVPEPEGAPGRAYYQEFEHVVTGSGLDWTIVRCGAFATNARDWWADMIREQDAVWWPYGDAGQAPIHEKDVAAVVGAALTGDDHVGRIHTITGPEVVTQRQQVEMIAAALGKPIAFNELTPEQTRQVWPQHGMSSPVVEWLLGVMAQEVTDPDPVLPTVEQITGRPARTFARWAAEHVDDFR